MLQFGIALRVSGVGLSVKLQLTLSLLASLRTESAWMQNTAQLKTVSNTIDILIIWEDFLFLHAYCI